MSWAWGRGVAVLLKGWEGIPTGKRGEGGFTQRYVTGSFGENQSSSLWAERGGWGIIYIISKSYMVYNIEKMYNIKKMWYKRGEIQKRMWNDKGIIRENCKREIWCSLFSSGGFRDSSSPHFLSQSYTFQAVWRFVWQIKMSLFRKSVESGQNLFMTHQWNTIKFWFESEFWCFISNESLRLLRIWWKKSSKEQHLFEIEILCNISIFTVSFDQINVSLQNKSINLFLKVHWPQTFERSRCLPHSDSWLLPKMQVISVFTLCRLVL